MSFNNMKNGGRYQSVLFGSSRPVRSNEMATTTSRDDGLYQNYSTHYFKPVMMTSSLATNHVTAESSVNGYPFRGEHYVREIKTKKRPNLDEMPHLDIVKTIGPFKMLAHDQSSQQNHSNRVSRGFIDTNENNCRPLGPILFVDNVTNKSARAQQEHDIMSERINKK